MVLPRPARTALPKRWHQVPLQDDELRALRAGEPIVAPFHAGSSLPCAGCENHPADLAVVVVLGAPPIEKYGWLREQGLDVMNAAVTEAELRRIERAEGAPTLSYVLEARVRGAPPVEVQLTLVPGAWRSAICREKGQNVEWGARLSADVLRPSEKVRIADEGE